MKTDRAFDIGVAKGLNMAGWSDRKISETTGFPRSTVQRWRLNNFLHKRRRGSGRRRTTTPRMERLINRVVTVDPSLTCSGIASRLPDNISRSTLKRRLKEMGIRSKRRPVGLVLSEVHKSARLTWAMSKCAWREVQWQRVCWSDEASVCLRAKDSRLRLWLRIGKEAPENLVVPRCQGGGGRLLIWGAIWFGGRSSLHIMRDNMNGERYAEVLRRYVPEIVQSLGDPACEWLFMEDNATSHKCQTATIAKQELGVRCLKWPAYSPDLNPIENAWSWLKREVRRALRVEHTIGDLVGLVQAKWDEMPQHIIDVWVLSMSRRCREVIERKGGCTHY